MKILTKKVFMKLYRPSRQDICDSAQHLPGCMCHELRPNLIEVYQDAIMIRELRNGNSLFKLMTHLRKKNRRNSSFKMKWMLRE